jgi:DNA-binding transcriptional LysR family regulator
MQSGAHRHTSSAHWWLFERHARGMAPTCYGEILVRHARIALSGLGLAREEITALKSGLSGRAAIGAVLHKLSPGAQLLLNTLRELAKQTYPLEGYPATFARTSHV